MNLLDCVHLVTFAGCLGFLSSLLLYHVSEVERITREEFLVTTLKEFLLPIAEEHLEERLVKGAFLSELRQWGLA